MQFVYEVILPNKVLRNHLLSENMQWNYASLSVTLNYLMHEIMEFCETSSFALDNWGQERCQTLGNKPNHSHQMCCDSLFHSVYLVFPKSLFLLKICLSFFICGAYVSMINAVLWRSARQSFASIGLFTWLVYVRTYCVPIATLNKTSELDYSIKNFPLSRCTCIKSFRIQL